MTIILKIALFREDPEGVMRMFSEALAFLDKNTERYMVDYYAEKAEAETARADKAEKERLAEKRNSAINMLKDGQSIKKVSEYLSMSEEELEKIREEVMK